MTFDLSFMQDGTIRLWDTETGSELACVNCKKQLIKARLLKTPDNKVVTKDNNDSDLELQGEGDDKDSEDKQNKSSEEDENRAKNEDENSTKNEDSEQNVQNSDNGENAENMETSDSAVDKSDADILDSVFRDVLSNKGQSEIEGCLLEGAVPQVEISALRLCPKKKMLAVSFVK